MWRMAYEIAPMSQITVHEASIAMSFWQRAIHDEDLARKSRRVIAEWRESLTRFF